MLKILRLLLWVLVLNLVALGTAVRAQDNNHVIEQVGGAKLDWTTLTLSTQGEGEPTHAGEGELVNMRKESRRQAEENVFKNLWRAVKLIPISDRETVGDRLARNTEAESNVKKVVREFKVEAITPFSDGSIKISAQVSLPPILSLAVGVGDEAPPLKPLPKKGRSRYSGLVLEAAGVVFDPILTPTLLAEDGTIFFNLDNVSGEAVAKQGMVGYYSSVAEAKKDKRVGTQPLVAKALRAAGRSSLVVPSYEVGLMQSGDSDLRFLEEGRVIIVVSQDRPN